MSRHESPELGAMMGRMLNALIRRAAEGDWEALEALSDIEALAPKATNAALCAARETYSLAELAAVMGVTRSAIAQRSASSTIARMTDTPDPCWHATCVGMRRCRRQ